MLKLQLLILGLLVQATSAWALPSRILLAQSSFHHQEAVLRQQQPSGPYQFMVCHLQWGAQQASDTDACRIVSDISLQEDQVENFLRQMIKTIEADNRYTDSLRWITMTAAGTFFSGSMAAAFAIVKHYVGLDKLEKPIRALTLDLLFLGAAYNLYKLTSNHSAKTKSYDSILAALYHSEGDGRKMIDIDEYTWPYFLEALTDALNKAKRDPAVWINSELIDQT